MQRALRELRSWRRVHPRRGQLRELWGGSTSASSHLSWSVLRGSSRSECRRHGVRVDLSAPAHGRRSTIMRGGLGRDFAHGALTGGAHGELGRRGELRRTRRTRGVRAPFSLGRRFTELR